jgi:casein kinase II subunit beta
MTIAMSCWLETFLSRPSSRLFIRVDEDFLLNRFNRYGLHSKLSQFDLAFDLLRSRVSNYFNPSKDIPFHVIESQAIILYAYLHARFLTTQEGLELMREKYESFQVCPRLFCRDTRCLPYGVNDDFGSDPAAWFCPSCGDLYRIQEAEIASVDAAFFGGTWVHLFVKVYPEVVLREARKVYVPKIFGFRIYNPKAPIVTRDVSSDG